MSSAKTTFGGDVTKVAQSRKPLKYRKKTLPPVLPAGAIGHFLAVFSNYGLGLDSVWSSRKAAFPSWVVTPRKYLAPSGPRYIPLSSAVQR